MPPKKKTKTILETTAELPSKNVDAELVVAETPSSSPSPSSPQMIQPVAARNLPPPPAMKPFNVFRQRSCTASVATVKRTRPPILSDITALVRGGHLFPVDEASADSLRVFERAVCRLLDAKKIVTPSPYASCLVFVKHLPGLLLKTSEEGRTREEWISLSKTGISFAYSVKVQRARLSRRIRSAMTQEWARIKEEVSEESLLLLSCSEVMKALGTFSMKKFMDGLKSTPVTASERTAISHCFRLLYAGALVYHQEMKTVRSINLFSSAYTVDDAFLLYDDSVHQPAQTCQTITPERAVRELQFKASIHVEAMVTIILHFILKHALQHPAALSPGSPREHASETLGIHQSARSNQTGGRESVVNEESGMPPDDSDKTRAGGGKRSNLPHPFNAECQFSKYVEEYKLAAAGKNSMYMFVMKRIIDQRGDGMYREAVLKMKSEIEKAVKRVQDAEPKRDVPSMFAGLVDDDSEEVDTNYLVGSDES